MLVAERPQRTCNREKLEQSVNRLNHTVSPAICELQAPTWYSHRTDTATGNNSQLFNMMTITIMMIQWPTALKHTVQHSLIWHTCFDILLCHAHGLLFYGTLVQNENIVMYCKVNVNIGAIPNDAVNAWNKIVGSVWSTWHFCPKICNSL